MLKNFLAGLFLVLSPLANALVLQTSQPVTALYSANPATGSWNTWEKKGEVTASSSLPYKLSPDKAGAYLLISQDGTQSYMTVVSPEEVNGDAVIYCDLHSRQSVTMKVTDEGGTPLKDIRVLMTDPVDGSGQNAKWFVFTDEDGLAIFNDVPDVAYFSAMAGNRRRQTNYCMDGRSAVPALPTIKIIHPIPGDIDGDGWVTQGDVNPWEGTVLLLAHGITDRRLQDRICLGLSWFDVNGDAVVDDQDLQKEVAAAYAGDLNEDGQTNVSDAILALRAIVGLQKLDRTAAANADMNGDGRLTVADVSVMLAKAIKK